MLLLLRGGLWASADALAPAGARCADAPRRPAPVAPDSPAAGTSIDVECLLGGWRSGEATAAAAAAAREEAAAADGTRCNLRPVSAQPGTAAAVGGGAGATAGQGLGGGLVERLGCRGAKAHAAPSSPAAVHVCACVCPHEQNSHVQAPSTSAAVHVRV
eukprot:1139991-Pelagomonas_calceolata.AAC.6